MSYKPNAQPKKTVVKSATDKPFKYPIPEAGSNAARISLIVDIGTQERGPYVDPTTKEEKPQNPIQQVVVFADLVDQVVDYGGDIGEKQYRLLLNSQYDNEIKGVNFAAFPPRDADGKLIEGKVWTFHPASLLTKLAKATGKEHILGTDPDNNMNIAELLGAAFYADVQVTSNEDKKGKKDADGNVIVYHNVKFGGASKLPLVKGKPVEVEELTVTPMILNHNNVTEETVILIRGKVLEMMKKAKEYSGSKLEQLLIARESSSSQAKPSTQDTPDVNDDSDSVDLPVDGFEDDIPF